MKYLGRLRNYETFLLIIFTKGAGFNKDNNAIHFVFSESKENDSLLS